MKAHVEIGETHNLELRHALLVYANGRRAFASLHDVTKPAEGAPLLGPARPLSLEFVRELASDLGSQAATPLKTAPFWNVAGDDGRVCLGTARAPEDISAASIAAWENCFHRSEYTHVLGAVRLTTHPGGFVGLWRSLAGKKRFPARYLTDAGETLREFIMGER